MNHFPAHRPKPSRLAVNSPGRFQEPEPAPVNESSPTDSFPPGSPVTTRVRLELPLEAALRLQQKWEEDPEACKAYFRAQGFEVKGMGITHIAPPDGQPVEAGYSGVTCGRPAPPGSLPPAVFPPTVIDTPFQQRLKLEVQRLFFITLDRICRLVRFMGNVVRQRHR